MDKPDDKVTEPEAATSNSTGPQNLILNTNKAGMEGLDTGKINEIIKNASEGSRFYQHKQKCQQQLDAKISHLRQAAASFTEEHIKKATLQMDQLIKELELNRDLSHTIVHVDMDMFYAAVEMRDDPVLRDKPMAVGGLGMLSTSNYAARKFGVRAAMPGFIGKKLCPDLVIVPPNFTKYKQVSKEIQEVFAEYDANYSQMSLDEAYLDITKFIHENASRYCAGTLEDCEPGSVSNAIVREIRHKIQAKTQLTASAGIAPNTRLAKICSDMNKPDGQYYLPPNRQLIMNFISALPIRKVCGIGNVTEQQLQALGINVCSHIMEKRGLLKLLFSDTSYNSFIRIALGLGHTTLGSWTEKDRKSISTETTFRDTADKITLFRLTQELCKELADDMEQKDIVGKVFTLKMKTSDFQIKTRAQTLSEATRSLDVMVSAARRILQHEMDTSLEPISLRLLGVRMSTLVNSSEMGSSRQTTLTQMFSQSFKPKINSVIDSEGKMIVENTCKLDVENQSNLKTICQYDDESSSFNTTISNTALPSLQDTNLITSETKKVSSHSTKNCLTIDGFLVKPGETSGYLSTENRECPVCGKCIQFTNLKGFIMHVDSCCEYNTTKGCNLGNDLISEFIIDNDKHLISISKDQDQDKTQVLCKTSQSGPTDIQYSGNTDANNEYCHTEKKKDIRYSENLQYPSVNEITRKVNTSMPEDPDNVFLCPVCEKKHYKTLESLNEHVDECLSSNAIGEMLQQDTVQAKHSGSSQIPSRHLDTSSHKSCEPLIGNKRKGNNSNKGKKQLRLGNNTLEKYFCS
ncbi:DNA polymerase kappa [Procambarus clarkii]|uniref:DNA polymerase kappa n=1 Tax=Procambarus clarkii TaxID=6728 RepID=UPI001E67461D|nr:DNA polymerase kappa-like [Procambarus clarkii]XP_045593335.1 DNA polymerase kappa-like [Procambarus clarkii]